ncbi:MAG: glutathione peroxidase [Saprospirales bacterium]|nr:glutathione peroxidase [Saprospirales bacterium]|tara:strand:+ start:3814 stop:4401 length:588 start_codon:yes stop_codon:yes gene_type:complete
MSSIKQSILKKLYPFIRKAAKNTRNGVVITNNQNIAPTTSLYDLEVVLSGGSILDMVDLKGKKILLVNTASDCGYTGQYEELQALHETAGDKVAIIAFPANDFGMQERKDDASIQAFCKTSYGVTFLIAKKGIVRKKAEQQPIYRWLTDKSQNGWNNHAPDWNFGKYLINEEGLLTHYFGPSISPVENDVLLTVH